MTKLEVSRFLKKISGTYPNQFFVTEDVENTWIEMLEPYDLEDVEMKFEEHLKGEMAEKPPLVHYLTKYLKKSEDKTKYDSEYKVACSICGEWLPISKYDKHYERCFTIQTLIVLLKEKGTVTTYEELNQYDDSTLNRLIDKYLPIKKDLKELI
jgi:hypothetical protein